MKLSMPNKMLDFIEEWQEQLSLHNVQNARPLDYVTREDVVFPPEATYPPFGEAGLRYAGLRDQITASDDHSAPQYHVDNAKVLSC